MAPHVSVPVEESPHLLFAGGGLVFFGVLPAENFLPLLRELSQPLLLVGGEGRRIEAERAAEEFDAVDPGHNFGGIENAEKDREPEEEGKDERSAAEPRGYIKTGDNGEQRQSGANGPLDESRGIYGHS